MSRALFWEEVHRQAVEAYRTGCREPHAILPAALLEASQSAGVSARVVFDYAEDFAGCGEPTAEDFAEIAEIRAAEFRRCGEEMSPPRIVPERALPLRSDEWEGIPWLPRIFAKARCFLAGTLADEVMFGCGGDRAFVKRHGISLPGFLRAVRDGGEAAAVAYVRNGRTT